MTSGPGANEPAVGFAADEARVDRRRKHGVGARARHRRARAGGRHRPGQGGGAGRRPRRRGGELERRAGRAGRRRGALPQAQAARGGGRRGGRPHRHGRVHPGRHPTDQLAGAYPGASDLPLHPEHARRGPARGALLRARARRRHGPRGRDTCPDGPCGRGDPTDRRAADRARHGADELRARLHGPRGRELRRRRRGPRPRPSRGAADGRRDHGRHGGLAGPARLRHRRAAQPRGHPGWHHRARADHARGARGCAKRPGATVDSVVEATR